MSVGKSHGSVAPLRNVSALLTLVDRVQNRDFGLPGMATFYGPSGYGKSSAATYTQNRTGAIHVEVQPVWRVKQVLEALAGELSLKPARTAPDLFNQVAEGLGRAQRPLLVDEADRVCRDDMIEMVRGLYDASEVPVILIGEEDLPMKLMQWERVHGRMLDWVAAEAAEMADLHQLVPIYAQGITLGEDLKAALLKASSGSLRRISTNLSHVKTTALENGWATVTMREWKDRKFYTGEAPPPRQGEARRLAQQKIAARRVS